MREKRQQEIEQAREARRVELEAYREQERRIKELQRAAKVALV